MSWIGGFTLSNAFAEWSFVDYTEAVNGKVKYKTMITFQTQINEPTICMRYVINLVKSTGTKYPT